MAQDREVLLRRSSSEAIERLAEWLYNRDAETFIRADWATDTDGLKSQYRDQAEAALRFSGVLHA